MSKQPDHDKAKAKAKAEPANRTIALNKRARHEYHLIDRVEAGLALQGWEVKAIRAGRLSVTRGHAFSAEDQWRARMIEALMCDFRIDAAEMGARFGLDRAALAQLFAPIAAHFGAMVRITADGSLEIPMAARPLTRMIAHRLDAYDMAATGHSTAI